MLTDATLFSETNALVGGLSAAEQRRLDRRLTKQCADESMGFYCESRGTIQSLGRRQTSEFVARLCHRYRHCAEPAAC